MARSRRSVRKQSRSARFERLQRLERLESKLALASDGPLLGATPAAPLLPKIEVSHFGQDISFVATSGPVKAVVVTNAGSGYTSAPSVAINANGAGSGATAVAVLGSGANAGTVVGITITNAGSGYTSKASITLSGGAGSGAAASLEIDLSNRQMFQAWANDYVDFITNSGATVAYINVGDYKTDNKHAYDYLRPELGDNGVPWIVTDFLDKLPQGVAAGTIAYLDVANPWHLYDPPANPAGSTAPEPNRNFAGNTFTTDGKATSPAMNNMYQSFLLVNQINAAVKSHTPAGGAPRKFITHYEADGEGAGAFETDTYYGFGGAAAAVGDAYNPATPNQTAPGGTWTWDASSHVATGWPVAGYGYTKWLWNHFMPGATDVPDDGIAVPLPAGGDLPDVVFSDTEATAEATWSGGTAAPYQFGIIKYAQTSWLKYSPGPMTAYTENYWFGENHYMPGPGSSIASDGTANINYVATPVLNAPTTNNQFSTTPTVTFNQPVDSNGQSIGTPAMGYAIMGTGAIDQTAFEAGTSAFFGGNGVGNGYSSGVWISPGKGGSGYAKGSKDSPNVTFVPQAGDTPSFPAIGYIESVDSNGAITSIVILDPGEGYTQEPSIVLPPTSGTLAEPEVYLTRANGYPVPVFPAAPGTGTAATGYVTVSSQGSGKPGQITNLVIRTYGQGYAQTPNTSVRFAPITAFTATGGIPGTQLTILDHGSGYDPSSPPNISIYKPPGGIGPTLTVVMDGDKIGSVNVTSPGSGYSSTNLPTITVTPAQSSGYDASPNGPLAGPGGLAVTFDTTVNGTYKWSPVIAQYPSQATVRVPTLYAPVNASSQQIAQIVITVLGDHYDTDANKPYYTLSGDATQTKHYLTGGVNGNGINPNYNGAYVPALDMSGGFPVDSTGRSSISIISCGLGYSAGAVMQTPGAGYDNQTNYEIDFPAPTGGGTAAKGLLLVNSDGAATGIVVTSPGSGYTTADDGQLITLPSPGTDGTAATAKVYLSNYPTVTIDAPGAVAGTYTPARPYVITGPTDPKNPSKSDPGHGYIVTGIGFTYPGVGYPKNTPFTFNFSAPADVANKAVPVAQALPALATKFSAASLPALGSIPNLSATEIHGGANAYNWQISNGFGPGQVSSVKNLVGGSGYTTAPQVTFSAPPAGGKQATGKAVVSGGAVTQILMDDNGYGYDPSLPVTVTIAAPGGTGTPATATVVLDDVQIMSTTALQTVYAHYAGRPDLLAGMFNDPLYQDVALPKLSEEFYWPLVWSDFSNANSTDGTQVPQRAIATFSIESMNRSNTYDATGTFVPSTTPGWTATRTALDSKYQSEDALSVPNTLGGTFSGLSSLTYAQFVDFLNSAATIIANSATQGGHPMTPKDVTFQVYDAAFLPIEWISQKNANRWGAANEAPVFVSSARVAVPENGAVETPIYVADVSDIGATVADRTVTYALKPGVGDAGDLAIDPRTGVVRLLAPANFEAKRTYQFVVVATDGGTPALAVEKAVTVDVTDVFEVPTPPAVSVPVQFPVVEDVRTPLVFAAQPFTDADSSAATTTMSVVLRVPEGTVAARSAGGVLVSGTGTARVFTGTLADLNSYFTAVPARILYTSAANRNGSVPLTVTVSEGTGSFAHVTTATSELVIAAVNDAPRAWAPAGFRVTEDVASILVWRGGAGPVADVDSPIVQVTLGVAEGVLEAITAPAVSVTGVGGNVLTFSGAPAAINALFRQPGAIKFTTAPDSVAPQQLTLTVSDGQAQAMAMSRITVRAVNDRPILAALATVTGAIQNTPLVIDRQRLVTATGVADVDSRRTLFVVEQVTSGTVQRWTGSAWATITPRTPLAGRIVSANDKLRWVPPTGAGASTAAFTVRAWDGRAFSEVASQVWVAVTVA